MMTARLMTNPPASRRRTGLLRQRIFNSPMIGFFAESRMAPVSSIRLMKREEVKPNMAPMIMIPVSAQMLRV